MTECLLKIEKQYGRDQVLQINDDQFVLLTKNTIDIYWIDPISKYDSISTSVNNQQCILIDDKKTLFVVSDLGLSLYSIPVLKIITTCFLKNNYKFIACLNKKKRIILPTSNSIFCFRNDLKTFSEIKNEKFSEILFIDSSLDESLVIAINDKNELMKLNCDTFNIENMITLSKDIKSMCIWNERNSVIVTQNKNQAFEYSLNDLKVIRSVSITDYINYPNICFSSPIVIISKHSFANAFENGYGQKIIFPFSGITIRDSNEENIYSMFCNKSKNLIVCSLYTCIRIYRLPLELEISLKDTIIEPKKIKLNEFSSIVKPKEDKKIPEISPSLNDKSKTKLNYVCSVLNPLFKGHSKVQRISEAFKLILKSFLKWTRNTYSKPPKSKQNYLLTNKLLIKLPSKKESKANCFRACVFFFDRKLKLVGETSSRSEPLSNFKINEIWKGNKKWTLLEETIFGGNEIKGYAIMNFANGWLKCYIWEGEVVKHANFKMLMFFDRIEREVIGVLNDDTVVTKGNLLFSLDFEKNKIRGTT